MKNWYEVTARFNSLIDSLLHRGSIGIVVFCTKVLPLRDRLESGERSGDLYAEIEKVIEQYDDSPAKKSEPSRP